MLAFLRYYTGAEILPFNYGLVFVAATLLLSILSFYLIEEPLRGKAPIKLRYLGYAALLAVIATTAWGYKKVNTYFSPPPLPVEYTRYADPDTICHGKIVGDCLKGDLNSDKEILVLGDSHAAMLNHFFDYLGKEVGFKARVITASSCVTIPGFDYERLPEWARTPCLDQIKYAEQFIDKYSVIAIAGMWSYQFESTAFKATLFEFVKRNQDKDVAVFAQIPYFSTSPIRNIRFNRLGLSTPIGLSKDYLAINDELKRVVHDSETKVVFDKHLIEKYLVGGKPIYHDESLLNEVGAKEYAVHFLKENNRTSSVFDVRSMR